LTNTSPPGNEVLADVANRPELWILLLAILGAGQFIRSVISRLVSLPESASVAKKRVNFSIFRQSIEDSDKRGIILSWLAEEVGELFLKDGVDSTGAKGLVSPT
jgi:hypothetical protein